MRRPWLVAAVVLAGSLLLSLAFWLAGLPFFIGFMFIPAIPFLSRERKVKRCPLCGWETAGSERFCPFDATPLVGTGGEGGE